ncbi:MAG: hypothetical protein HOH86_10815, partial [Verrucomicrobiales bacterium]|nr:hypothetical protein [Verrucomicrobiales bacterium]
MKIFCQRIAFVFLLLTFVGGLGAIDVEELPPPAKRKVNFVKEILPIFKKHCVKCHGPDKQKSDYRIDVKARAFEG